MGQGSPTENCPRSEVNAIETALQANRDYVRIINARIARLERAGRN